MQARWLPKWKKEIVFKAPAGVYQQPPFYREIGKYDGSWNESVKAQKRVQFVAEMDYNFLAMGNKPFRVTAEAYYKYIKDLAPYDIDNVKIRYLGNNNAKGYATGIEFRVFGELLKDAESWLSVGLMRTKEDL